RFVEDKPIRVPLAAGRHLTIRGVGGTSGSPAPPTVKFLVLDKSDSARGMLELDHGKLTLDNLQLEMTVDEDAETGDVAMLRLAAGGVEHLELSNCVLSVRRRMTGGAANPLAFIDVAPPPITSVDGPADPMPAVLPINVENCIARGEATLVRMRQSFPCDLVWRNGLCVTSERLLLAEGTATPSGDASEGTLRLALEHVTVYAGQGLCLLRDSEQRPQQPPLELECSECIIVAAGADSLVKHDGVGEPSKYGQALFIKGSRNFYDGVDTFWRAVVGNVEQDQWDWMAWRKRLAIEGMPSYAQPIRWRRDRAQVDAAPFHLQGIDDYALQPEESNPALRAKAGFDAATMPQIIRSPVAETAPAAPPAPEAL
ncbi:MAG: hypothetical protein KDA41_15630, partial [Planctomycetales bacterium]|nr:hypothetical protein [Planctomycetales bacterium]